MSGHGSVGAPQGSLDLERRLWRRATNASWRWARPPAWAWMLPLATHRQAQPAGEPRSPGCGLGRLEEGALELDPEPLRPERLAQQAHARLVVHPPLGAARQADEALDVVAQGRRGCFAGAGLPLCHGYGRGRVNSRQRLLQPRAEATKSVSGGRRRGSARPRVSPQPEAVGGVGELHRSPDAVVIGQGQRSCPSPWPLRPAPRASTPRRGRSRPSGSGARRIRGLGHRRRGLAQGYRGPGHRWRNQPPPSRSRKTTMSATGLADELPVAAAQRLLGPPAILDQPRFADLGHRLAVDPRWPYPRVGLDPGSPRAAESPRPMSERRRAVSAQRPAHDSNGASIIRRSGIRDACRRPPPVGRRPARRPPAPGAPLPKALPSELGSLAQEGPLSAGRRPEAVGRQPEGERRRREQAQARDQRQPHPLRVGRRLAEGDRNPPAPAPAGAAVGIDQAGGRVAPRRLRPRRSGLASRRSIRTPRACSSAGPDADSWSSNDSASSSTGRRGVGGRPRRRPACGPRRRPPEAVGQRGPRHPGELAERGNPSRSSICTSGAVRGRDRSIETGRFRRCSPAASRTIVIRRGRVARAAASAQNRWRHRSEPACRAPGGPPG